MHKTVSELLTKGLFVGMALVLTSCEDSKSKTQAKSEAQVVTAQPATAKESAPVINEPVPAEEAKKEVAVPKDVAEEVAAKKEVVAPEEVKKEEDVTPDAAKEAAVAQEATTAEPAKEAQTAEKSTPAEPATSAEAATEPTKKTPEAQGKPASEEVKPEESKVEPAEASPAAASAPVETPAPKEPADTVPAKDVEAAKEKAPVATTEEVHNDVQDEEAVVRQRVDELKAMQPGPKFIQWIQDYGATFMMSRRVFNRDIFASKDPLDQHFAQTFAPFVSAHISTFLPLIANYEIQKIAIDQAGKSLKKFTLTLKEKSTGEDTLVNVIVTNKNLRIVDIAVQETSLVSILKTAAQDVLSLPKDQQKAVWDKVISA